MFFLYNFSGIVVSMPSMKNYVHMFFTWFYAVYAVIGSSVLARHFRRQSKLFLLRIWRQSIKVQGNQM